MHKNAVPGIGVAALTEFLTEAGDAKDCNHSTGTGNNGGSWRTWAAKYCNVSGATGVHDLHLNFAGGSGYINAIDLRC